MHCVTMSGKCDGDSLRGLYLDFSVPGRTTHKDENHTLSKLCEVGKEYLFLKAKQLILDHANKPVLFSYSSDSTPLLMVMTHAATLGPHRTVVRKAGKANELLIQRGFVKASGNLGEARVVCMFRDPVPLTNGKSAACCSSAACDCSRLFVRLATRTSSSRIMRSIELFIPVYLD